MSVPEERSLSQRLDECLDARDRMIHHAEHLQEDLMGALEVIGRVQRLLSRWEHERVYTANAHPTREKTFALNALDKHIEELKVALTNISLDESPRKEDEI